MPNSGAASGDMVAYLKGILSQLEDAQGGKDEEASAALAELEKQTSELATLRSRSEESAGPGPVPGQLLDEVQVARELDRLDARLSELEDRLESADDGTKQMLGTSTKLWLQQSQDKDIQRGGEG